MNRVPFLEKSSRLDRTTRFTVSQMIVTQSYAPRCLIPIQEDYIYVVKKGMIKCSFIEKTKNIDMFLLVEDDIFGNAEWLEILPYKYNVQYYSLENTCVFLIPKTKWYGYVATNIKLHQIWMEQIEKQQLITTTWLKQCGRIKKENIFLQILQKKPQLLKRDRVRHLYKVLNLEFNENR